MNLIFEFEFVFKQEALQKKPPQKTIHISPIRFFTANWNRF